MSDTSARLLTLLSLLQTPREWPGSELARRLNVSLRTVRRDMDRLRDLGYPVQATMGATGGYRLVAGRAMPPLLLDDDEAVAIAIGLSTAARHAVDGIDDASIRALAKLQQVLPTRLRHRVTVLGTAVAVLTGAGPTVDPQRLIVLAAAAAAHERVRFAYQAHDGAESQRLVEPHRLVCAGHRWYLVAYDTDRADWRIFRVDRIHEPRATGVRTTPRELPDDDAGRYVRRKLYGLAPTYRAVVTLHASADEIATRLGAAAPGGVDAIELEPIDAHTSRWHTHADTVEWLAFRLATLGCEFEVHDPPQLATYLRGLGARLTRAATAPADLRT